MPKQPSTGPPARSPGFEAPRIATLLVYVALGRARAASAVAELRAEYRSRRLPELGRARATLWYWREAASLACWFAWLRLSWVFSSTGAGFMNRDVYLDVRHALRIIRKRPGYSLATVLTLAVAIGVNGAIFSIVDSVLLRPLPLPHSERLVRIWHTDEDEGDRFMEATFDEYEALRSGAQTLENVVAFTIVLENLADDTSTPTRVLAARTTPGLLGTLGLTPAAGRVFTDDELASGHTLVVLAHSLWQQRYGADPGIVGRTVLLDGVEHEVVGVMPATFRLPSEVTVWRPFTVDELAYRDDDRELTVVGRLPDGAGLDAASAEVDALARRGEGVAAAGGEIGAWAQPLRAMVVRDVRLPLLLLAGAVTAVLLIACANVAGLALADGSRRAREMTLRGALGASRGRIVRQSLTETVTLAVVAGVAGLAFAWLTQRLVIAFTPTDVPRLEEVALDGRAMLTMAALTLVVGTLAGLLPALRASGPALQRPASTTTTGAAGRLQAGLVVGEVAVSLVLAVCAVMLTASFGRMLSVDRGFEVEGLLAVDVELPEADQRDTHQSWSRILERLRALPGVRSAAAGLAHPMDGYGINLRVFRVRGFPDPNDRPGGFVRLITPEYFETAGIPVVDGRVFSSADGPDGARVGLVSDTFARARFGDIDPVGRVLEMATPRGPAPLEIVGVVGSPTADIGDPAPEILYLPVSQHYAHALKIMVRAETDPTTLAGSVRQAIWEVVPNAPLGPLETMQQIIDRRIAAPRFMMSMVGGFAAMALALAALGTYALVAFEVARRTREIGVRQALGADRTEIRAMVLRQGAARLAVGLAIGTAGALAIGRTLRGVLYEIDPADPRVVGIGILVVSAAALLAAWLPARRATRVDPVVALASE